MHSRVRARLALGFAAVLACSAATAVRAELRIEPADLSSGEYLTGDVEVVAVSGDAGVVLRTPDGQRGIPDIRSIHFSGGTLLGLANSAGGVEAVMFDASGRFMRRVAIDRGATAIAFGTGLITYAAAQHEPGAPYALRLHSPRGSREIRHADRTLLDLTSLAEHLVVSSIPSAGIPTIRVEVLDESGDPAWEYLTERVGNRVVVDSGRAAALAYDGGGSELRVFDETTRTARVLALNDGSLSNLAFVRPGTEILVWGRTAAILVDPIHARVLWRSRGFSDSQIISNRTSSVSAIDRSIALVGRREQIDGVWAVELVLLDHATGALGPTRHLFDANSMPTVVKRYPNENGERLVFRTRAFDLLTAVEADP